jgi:hypothetical protein
MTNRLNFNQPSPEESEWITLAKAQKETFFQLSERGDMPPVVVGEKEGKLVLAVVAPQIDKFQGLDALSLLRRGFDIDACAFLTDSFIVRADLTDREDISKRYNKPGSMQEAFQNGSDEVMECITCLRYSPDRQMELHSLPYVVTEHKIDWADDDLFATRGKDGEVSGALADAICQIMTEVPFIIEEPELIQAAKFLGLEEREKQEFHIRRAMRTTLMSRDYLVMECVEIRPDATQEEMVEQFKAKVEETRDLDPNRANNLWGLSKGMSGDGGPDQTPFHNPFL